VSRAGRPRAGLRVLGALLLACVLDGARAEEHPSRPAAFGDAAWRFIERLALPADLAFETAAVRCAGSLQTDGRFETVLCYEPGDDPEREAALGAAVTRTVQRLRLQPARLEGRRVPVWFRFTVALSRTDEGDRVTLFPHHGLSLDALGPVYVGAQRVLDAAPPRCLSRPGANAVALTARVDGSGRAHDVATDPDDDCGRDVAAAVASSRFLPARKDGKPVEGLYDEVFPGG
jgi:hypothetical protein